MTIQYTSNITAVVSDQMGTDRSICNAARVSTLGIDAEDASTAGDEKLISYLMKNKHGSPFEHGAITFIVTAPIFVFWDHVRHRIGCCLSGDTEVWQESRPPNSGTTIRKRPIAELWRNWHQGVPDSMGRTRKLDSCRNFKVRTLDETTGRMYPTRVVDIYQNGEKQLYRFTTQKGQSIRATLDHQVYTPDGWRKFGELVVGDRVAVSGIVAARESTSVPPSLRRGIGVWTSMQRKTRIKPEDECYLCRVTFERKDLELDHVVPVVDDLLRALDPNNLKPSCRECHTKKSNSELPRTGLPRTAAGAVYSPLASITKDAVEQTYDLELEGPMRGFVADGIVVHNSYNIESSRYKELQPLFYRAADARTQTGKPGHYVMQPGTEGQTVVMHTAKEVANTYAWNAYQAQLKAGIAREQAMEVLPMNTVISAYVTFNPRSLMHFLELRSVNARLEMQMLAKAYRVGFEKFWPATAAAFETNERIAP